MQKKIDDAIEALRQIILDGQTSEIQCLIGLFP